MLWHEDNGKVDKSFHWFNGCYCSLAKTQLELFLWDHSMSYIWKMVWPGHPQSQQERHWTNCQHDLHTSCQQHLGCSVKEWWVTDVLGNAAICPFSEYIPCETMHLNGCHGDTLTILNISILLVVITKVNNLTYKYSRVLVKVFKCSHIVWKENGWWLPSGMLGKKIHGEFRNSTCAYLSGDVMRVYYLISDLLKFYSAFIKK